MIIFFFKQKTAYDLRIRDWSSDVCSSDLPAGGRVACSAQLTPSFPALQPAPSFCCTTTRRAVELLLPGLGSTTPAGGVTVAVLTSRSRLAARRGGRGTGHRTRHQRQEQRNDQRHRAGNPAKRKSGVSG